MAKDYFFTFVSMLFILLAPIKAFLLMILSLLIIDTLYAVYSTVRYRGGWGAIESHKLINFFPKLLFYFGGIILTYYIDTYIIGANLILNIENLFLKAATTMAIVTEVKSIDETSTKNGNKPLLTWIRSIIKDIKGVKKDLKDLSDNE